MTRVDLAKFGDVHLPEVLATMHTALVRVRGGFTWISRGRGPSKIQNPCKKGDDEDHRFGADACDCYAQVYLDRILMYRGDDGEHLFDVGNVPIDDIQGIEYYAGPAETLEYTKLNSPCGVLVIWTNRAR